MSSMAVVRCGAARAVDERWEAPQPPAPYAGADAEEGEEEEEEDDDEPESLVDSIISFLREMVCLGPDVGTAMLEAGLGAKVTAWGRRWATERQ